MDGVSLVNCMSGEGDCPELDAFNETGIWLSDIPGLPEKHLRYPDLLELIDIPDRERGTLAIKQEYRDRIMTAKDLMLRRGRWKLVYQPLEEGYLLRLFDLDSDPDCQQDVAAKYPDVGDDLWRRLKAFMPDVHG